jgi:hypothetical protein
MVRIYRARMLHLQKSNLVSLLQELYQVIQIWKAHQLP